MANRQPPLHPLLVKYGPQAINVMRGVGPLLLAPAAMDRFYQTVLSAGHFRDHLPPVAKARAPVGKRDPVTGKITRPAWLQRELNRLADEVLDELDGSY